VQRCKKLTQRLGRGYNADRASGAVSSTVKAAGLLSRRDCVHLMMKAVES